jgi:hypothetical protein
VVPGDNTEVWGVYIYTGVDEGDSRIGEDRRGKETDRCPLTVN